MSQHSWNVVLHDNGRGEGCVDGCEDGAGDGAGTWAGTWAGAWAGTWAGTWAGAWDGTWAGTGVGSWAGTWAGTWAGPGIESNGRKGRRKGWGGKGTGERGNRGPLCSSCAPLVTVTLVATAGDFCDIES